MSKPVMIFPFAENDEVHTTGRELTEFADLVRNATLSEVLSVVTAKLNPGKNSPAIEMNLIDVLRSVNDMRTPEPEAKGEN